MSTSSAPLTTFALVCTLKPPPALSSSELMATQILAWLATHDISGEVVRVVDHCIKPGVELDTGTDDDWPSVRAKMMSANIVIVATPTWLGKRPSVCQRVLERLDAELSETDEDRRPLTYGNVALTALVGNENGRPSHCGGAVPVSERCRIQHSGWPCDVPERRSALSDGLRGPR